NFKLIRISHTTNATFGVLLEEDIPFCVTLERPWLGNIKSISCIPEGFYTFIRIESPKFGDTFKAENVPNRSHILFHKGNLSDDTHGCILVGEQFEPLKGENAVLASGKAFAEFKERTRENNTILLQIESHK
ncbi:unnamed protein product, partial [marine sediment metagenome]